MEITGVEINFVVPDCREALQLYSAIFDIEILEATNLPAGSNEAVFMLYGMRLHMLDHNPQYHLIAPASDDPRSVWLNITVPDIAQTLEKALANGCTLIMPINKMEEMGISNAMFSDPYHHPWLLHEIHRTVGFEERLGAIGKQ